LSISDKLLPRARKIARRQGKSLNALLQGFLEQLAGRIPADRIAEELLREFQRHGGHSKGRQNLREDAYAGRT